MTSLALKYLAISAVALAAIGAASSGAQAQQVYRIVGPDGKVTFSDKPPPTTSNAKVTSGTGASGGAGSASSNLPFDLRQVASKYPVTLYTGENCRPCGSARALLIGRGVPFTEKTVTTVDDAAALQRLSGENSLPFGTIGGQQLKGFSDAEWTQFLNAAGYPASSILPTNYRQPPATPLVVFTTAPSSTPNAAASPVPDRAAHAPVQPGPTADNPGGIRF